MEVEGSNKKELMDAGDSMVIVGGGGQMEVQEGIRWVKGNGKTTIKKIIKYTIPWRLVHSQCCVTITSASRRTNPKG